MKKEEGQDLMRKITNLNQKDYRLTDEEKSEETSALEAALDKLEYQHNHLEKSIVAEAKCSKPKDNTLMTNLLDELTAIFNIAITCAFPEVPIKAAVVLSQNVKNGDYQCNSAMGISGYLSKSLKTKSIPRDVAKEIIKHLPDSDLIEFTTIGGPGFINIKLSSTFVNKCMSNIFVNGVKVRKVAKKSKMVIDFSSPNIAKEMHVGHLRSTIIGNCLANLFEYLGHSVLRLNHVGDYGTQFGMLIAHLQDKFPNYAEESPPIADLQAFYKQSKKRFDDDPEFHKRAKNLVCKLQSREHPDITGAWNLICDVSRKAFQLIYDRLNVKNLVERGESFYYKLMVERVQELEKLGLVTEQEGRKLVFVDADQYPLTVVKSDGGFTYDSSDLACIKQRIFDEKADILLYVTDSGQSSHFDLIFKAARAAGWYDPSKVRVEHIGFGCVLGEDKKKFKTRSGETVRLMDLLDEGISRCEQKLAEKGRGKDLNEAELDAVKKAVAYGCIKYADLSHNLTNDYVFSYDKMLEDRGNTAAYLLYAFTRIKSIIRNSGVSEQALQDYAKTSHEAGNLKFEHEKETKLAKCMLKFPDVLSRVSRELTPNTLCEYLYELSTTFTEFYDSCYCIEKNKDTGAVTVHMDRLLLTDATASVMSECFSILGLQTVSKM